MSCVGGRNCDEDLTISIKSHGITVGYCERHATDREKTIKGGDNLPSDDHLHDYIRLCAILESKELFFASMANFTDEVSRAEKSRQGISSWFNRDKIPIKLNQSLSYYEQLCWFGGQQKIMSGLLTAQEFTGAIQNGYMVKDPGPGPDHGEYSHRIQWQYIMRIVTNKFSVPKTSDWKLTPLQQYCGMITPRNVWGAILEGNTIMQGTPGSPDWVNRQFRDGNSLSTTSFGVSITKRYNRRVEMVTEVQSILQGRGQAAKPKFSVQAVSTAPKKVNEVNAHAVIEYLYKWKKAGRPASKPAAQGVGNQLTIQTMEIDEAWHLWDTLYARKYRNARQQFQRATYNDSDDPTTKTISDGLLLHRSEVVTDAPLEARIASSKTTLNPKFAYSSSTGAKKR